MRKEKTCLTERKGGEKSINEGSLVAEDYAKGTLVQECADLQHLC